MSTHTSINKGRDKLLFFLLIKARITIMVKLGVYLTILAVLCVADITLMKKEKRGIIPYVVIAASAGVLGAYTFGGGQSLLGAAAFLLEALV